MRRHPQAIRIRTSAAHPYSHLRTADRLSAKMRTLSAGGFTCSKHPLPERTPAFKSRGCVPFGQGAGDPFGLRRFPSAKRLDWRST